MTSRHFPQKITQHTLSGELEIAWEAGQTHRYSHGKLRQACRCADCLSGNSSPASQRVRLVTVQAVGSYGLQLEFDDGHGRGIYPWIYLWELGNAALE
jgi:DUF971 family protein